MAGKKKALYCSSRTVTSILALKLGIEDRFICKIIPQLNISIATARRHKRKELLQGLKKRTQDIVNAILDDKPMPELETRQIKDTVK